MMNKKVLLLIAACALLPFMVSTQSFWIDECGSARFACAPNWGVFFELMKVDLSSDSQMPLFMLLSRVWYLIAGHSEYALRSINILFGVLSVIGAFLVAKKMQVRPWLMVGLLVVHPFLWAYMDEFRPYVMQMAGGWLMVLALLQMRDATRPGSREAGVFFLATVLLVGSSLLGVIPLAVFGGLWAVLCFRKIRSCTKEFWGVAGLLVLFVGAFGLFYLSKMLHGGGGSKSWELGIGNIVFSLYELFGFSGLGPGRTELRAAAAGGAVVGAIRFYIPFLVAMGVVCGLLFIEAFRLTTGRRKNLCFAAGLIVTGFGTLLILAMIFQWPFWGRHLAPFFPVVVVVFALLLENILQRATKIGTAGVFAVLGLLVVSALNVRFSDRFAKDDYRGAYQIVRPMIAAGKIVWWSANAESAFYYGVIDSPLDHLPKNMLPIFQKSTEQLKDYSKPQAVILSKPELYDKSGGIRQYLRDSGYRCDSCFRAISVWVPAGVEGDNRASSRGIERLKE